jgi:hypothetical protein
MDKGHSDARNLLWKIFITCAASAGTYAATTFFERDDMLVLMLSAFVGGVTLVVQFLLEVEARQGSVDANLTAFAQHQRDLTDQLETSVKTHLERSNQANSLLARLDAGPLGRQPVLELVQHAAGVDHSAPELAHRLAESEIRDLSNFLKDLGRGREVAADDEGWGWTFTLTNNAQQTIDATSYIASGDNDVSLRDDDIWISELAQRYLDRQAQAIKRGVNVRRIFILETLALADHPGMRLICEMQIRIGIDMRTIDVVAATGIASRHIPLVIFDRAVSLDLTPSRFPTTTPGFVKATLVLNPFQVHERVQMFERLWLGANKYEGT